MASNKPKAKGKKTMTLKVSGGSSRGKKKAAVAYYVSKKKK